LQGKQDRSIKKKSRSEENTLERREENKKRERQREREKGMPLVKVKPY
jgi:hypothetical protein